MVRPTLLRAANPRGDGGYIPPIILILPIAGNSLIFFHHACNEKYLGVRKMQDMMHIDRF